METELETETYNKPIYIILGILVIIIFIVILNMLTGGSVFRSMICMMVWYLPFSGSVLAGYVGCGGVAL